jgi:diguanylate cyclase (GGDEF)-like protein
MIHRQSIFLILSLVIALAGCNSAPEKKGTYVDTIKTYKDIPTVTAEEITAIEALKAKGGKFSFGTMIGTEMFRKSDGNYDGYTVKFCDLLTHLFGIEFVPVVYERDKLNDALKENKVDFTGVLTPTKERMEGGVYFMSLPIAEHLLRLFTLKGSETIHTEAELDGQTIAFLEGTVTEETIRRQYRVDFKSVSVANYAEAAEKIKSGEIRGFIFKAVSEPAFDEYDFIQSQIVYPIVRSPVSMTTLNRELKPIIDVVDKYILHFTAQGGNILYDLYEASEFAYAKTELFDRLLTSEEKAYIQDLKDGKEKVRIAVSQDRYPTNFYNQKEKKHQGIAIDVLEKISDLVDIEFEYVSSEDLLWAEIYEKVKTGEIPMMALFLPSEQRKEFFIAAENPYDQSYYGFMSKNGFPNQANFQIARHTVGVLKSSAYADLYHDLFPGIKKPNEYDSIDDCLDALERGDIDLLVASEYMMITQTHYREKTGFKINLRLASPLDAYFGFNKNETVLCSIVSKAQRFVQTDVIANQWKNRSFDYSKKIAEEQVFYARIFGTVVTFLLAASVFLLIRTIRLEKKLEVFASKDALTDIFNRRYFMELATIHIDRSFRINSPCFVVIYDLDHFKLVNDKFGHLAGDQVLKETAARIKKAIRPYDLFGRYGGEEFILVMSDVNETNVFNAVERLRLMICAAPVEYEDLKIPISASFGISSATPPTDINIATKHADEALYRAKEGGRNRVVVFRDDHMSLISKSIQEEAGE